MMMFVEFLHFLFVAFAVWLVDLFTWPAT